MTAIGVKAGLATYKSHLTRNLTILKCSSDDTEAIAEHSCFGLSRQRLNPLDETIGAIGFAHLAIDPF